MAFEEHYKILSCVGAISLLWQNGVHVQSMVTDATSMQAQSNLKGDQFYAGTLPKDGVSQNVDVYQPCTLNVLHVHPRGTEIYYLINGGSLQAFLFALSWMPG